MNVNWTSQAFPMMNMRAPSRDDFPTVILDANATQKFAEIEVQWGCGPFGRGSRGFDGLVPTADDEDGETSGILIRGAASAEFHQDAAAPTMRQLRRAGLCASVTGGGRIVHDAQRRSIFVYGYSMQYGPADVERVAELCREAYPGYHVTWSKGGY